jgi:hypothetical protein
MPDPTTAATTAATSDTTTATPSDTTRSSRAAITLAWLAVGVPLAWGVSQTIAKSLALFE